MKPLFFALLFLTLASAHRVVFAVQLQFGDIVAPQSDNFGTVIVVHPSTGDREILSLYPNIGAGPAMSRPTSILTLPDGNFLVSDTFAHNALTQINAATGNRTDVSSASIGTGPWGDVQTVLLTSAGDTIMVADGFVARVNLATGNRTLISGLGAGSGPTYAFSGAGGAVLYRSGRLAIGTYDSPLDNDQPAVYDVDLTTGARSILSGAGHGSGPPLSHIMDLAILPDGALVASGRDLDVNPNVTELIRIDPFNGNRTIIATQPFAQSEYERLTLAPNGFLLGSDPFTADAIYSINPTTGARTLISGNARGNGPSLFWGDMVVVPEPSAVTLFVTALAAWTFIAFRTYQRTFRGAASRPALPRRRLGV